mmetsp:Transcript_113083/g.316002  ORF Transcript_113083/g.316002 Transcript_113083/m.316002 type:complete len:82 (-) Transcript_113083:13-258(-)
MLFFLCHMLLSPVQTSTWDNKRDLKAQVKGLMSVLFSVLAIVTLSKTSGIIHYALVCNFLADSLCFAGYLWLRRSKVKGIW